MNAQKYGPGDKNNKTIFINFWIFIIFIKFFPCTSVKEITLQKNDRFSTSKKPAKSVEFIKFHSDI